MVFTILFSSMVFASKEISTCSVLDQAGETYLLTADIIDSDVEPCMNVLTDNIVFDCQNYLIDGVGNNYGVLINGRNNITVQNCNITEWNQLIQIENSSSCMIMDNFLTNSTLSGMRIEAGENLNNVVKNNYFKNIPTYGLWFTNGRNFTFENNTIVNKIECGIPLDNVSDSVITGNSFINASGSIWCGGVFSYRGSSNNTISYNNFSGFFHGILLNNVSNFTIYNNNIFNNIDGIHMNNASQYNKIYNNLFNNTVNANTNSCEGTFTNCSDVWSVCQSWYWEDESCCSYFGCGWSGSECSGATGNDCSIFFTSSEENCDIMSECDFVNISSENYWNTTKKLGTRIYSDGIQIGGNYWTNSTSNGYSDTCTDSNTDGFCDSALNITNMVSCTIGVDCGDNVDYLPYSDEYDFTLPTYSSNSTNSTLRGTAVNHSLKWTDNINLSGYIFSDNITGTWRNSSFVSFSGTSNTSSNITITNVTKGVVVAWCFYANDTTNNWNGTSCNNPFTYIVTDTFPKYSNMVKNSLTYYNSLTATQFNVTWTDDLGISYVLIESNFSGTPANYTTKSEGSVYYNNSYILPAGNFYWKTYANDTYNQWNSSGMINFTINKNVTICTLYANGTASDRTYTFGEGTNLTGTINTDDNLELNLSTNASFGQNFQTATAKSIGNVSNTTDWNSTSTYLSTYNWTVSSQGNANYSSCSATRLLSVTDIGIPQYSDLKTRYSSPVDYDSGLTHEFNATWTDNVAIDDVILQLNTTNYSYLAGEILNEGDEFYFDITNLSTALHNYTWYANDTFGNDASTTNYNYIVRPVITIITPLNETESSIPLLNFTYSTSNPDKCWFSLNGGTNFTLRSCNASSLFDGNNTRYYDNFTFNTSDKTYAILELRSNGTYIWVFGKNLSSPLLTSVVLRYLPNGTYDNWGMMADIYQSNYVQTFSEYDGTYFYLGDQTLHTMFRILPNGTYDGWYLDPSLGTGEFLPSGCVFNGTYWFCDGALTAAVYRYLPNATYDNWNFSLTGQGFVPNVNPIVGFTPWLLDFDNNYFQVGSVESNMTFEYYANGTYDGLVINYNDYGFNPTTSAYTTISYDHTFITTDGVYTHPDPYFWIMRGLENQIHRFVDNRFLMAGNYRGPNNVLLCVNDTYGGENCTQQWWTFDVPPYYWSVEAVNNPTSPTNSSVGSYQFNSTWIDNIAMDDVILQFNNTNYSSAAGQISRDGDEFYITLSSLSANALGYDYKWFANDSANNWSSTDTYKYYIDASNPVRLNMSTNSFATNTTDSNISVSIVNTVNMDCWLDDADIRSLGGTCSLYVDNVLQSTPYSSAFTLGTHTVKVNSSGASNYIPNSTGGTFYVIVTNPGGGVGGGGSSETIIENITITNITIQPYCGDGICDIIAGESITSCPLDCKKPPGIVAQIELFIIAGSVIYVMYTQSKSSSRKREWEI